MPKGSHQKLKLLYLQRILLEHTDADHTITLSEIIRLLEGYGVTAERKSLYDDMEALRLYGMDVECRRGKNAAYYVASRPFDLAELKILVDAVQSSRFLTARKSRELIRKISSLTSRHEAKQLQREVYIPGRIKSMNESILYSIDAIQEAIAMNRQLSFRYTEWFLTSGHGEIVRRRPRRGGEPYVVSPWALVRDNDHYYLVAFDAKAGVIKHYRVDKISSPDILKAERVGQEKFSQLDMTLYAQKFFGMFHGEEESVTICFHNHLIGVVMDRFGKEAHILPRDEDHFTMTARVNVSEQFFGWVFGLGDKVAVLSPPWVADRMREQLNSVLSQYEPEGKREEK